MPWNLVDLIRASGGAGVVNQSFRGDVNPKSGVGMDGKDMVSYTITALDLYGGVPVGPGEVDPYNSGHVFNVTGDIVRGTNAFEIQSLLQSAWALELELISGFLAGASVSFSSFSQTGDGASFSLGLQVTAPLDGTPIPSVGLAMIGSQPEAWDDPWYGNWVPAVGSSGGGGTSDLRMRVTYTPDAFFNPQYTNGAGGWPFRINNRNYSLADISFRMWDNETAAINQTNDGRFMAPWSIVSYGNNHSANVNTQAWWRWSSNGGLSWSAVQGPVAVTDTRNET